MIVKTRLITTYSFECPDHGFIKPKWLETKKDGIPVCCSCKKKINIRAFEKDIHYITKLPDADRAVIIKIRHNLSLYGIVYYHHDSPNNLFIIPYVGGFNSKRDLRVDLSDIVSWEYIGK